MDDASRRDFIQRALLGLAATPWVAGQLQAEQTKAEPTTAEPSSAAQPSADQPTAAPPHDLPANWHGTEKIAMLIYPGFTALDLFGPHHIFASMMGAEVFIVAKDEQPVETDARIKVTPTATFETCPRDLTVLFVPGGTIGTLAAGADPATRKFLVDRAATSKWITSVCTGSVVLGAAGLLRGYRATSHWIVTKDLEHFGAIPVEERVVVDRNRMTGAGVTSGIDFALSLVKTLRGDD